MYVILNDELYHHGIKGQKWGVRRFQNSDGSLTTAGAKRYGSDGSSGSSKPSRTEKKAAKREAKEKNINEYKKILSDTKKAYAESDKMFDEAKKVYDSLGPNRIARMKEVSKAHKGKGSEAAKKYLDLYDKAAKVADDAFDRKTEAKYYNKNYTKSIQKKAEKRLKSEEMEARLDKYIANEKANKKYYEETVKPLYKSLSETKLGRAKEVMKAKRGKGSEAANEYLKMINKFKTDKKAADKEWNDIWKDL